MTKVYKTVDLFAGIGGCYLLAFFRKNIFFIGKISR